MSWRKTVLWDKLAFLAKKQLAGEDLPSDQSQEHQRPMHQKFVRCVVPTRCSVRKQPEISWSMAHPTINAYETPKGFARFLFFTAPKLLWCYPRQPSFSQDRRTQRCELGSMLCDTVEIRLQTFDFGETPNLQRSHKLRSLCHQGESEVHAALRGACRFGRLVGLMMDLGFRMKAELHTDSPASKGLATP